METESNAKGGVKMKSIKKKVGAFSITKRFNLDKPIDETDEYGKAAEKLSESRLKKELLKIYKSNIEQCTLIKDMVKGEDENTPNSLLRMIVPYWREYEFLPPIAEKAPRRSKATITAHNQKIAILVKLLKEYYEGDNEKSIIIENSKKAELVTMIVEYWNLKKIDPIYVDFN
jgi:hypothetical protein